MRYLYAMKGALSQSVPVSVLFLIVYVAGSIAYEYWTKGQQPFRGIPKGIYMTLIFFVIMTSVLFFGHLWKKSE